MNANLKEYYLKIRQLLNNFSKKDYWDTFNQSDFFCFYDEEPIYITFLIDDGVKCLDIFMLDNQLEYLYDFVYSSSINIPPYGAENFYRLELKDKSKLDNYERLYLDLEVQTKVYAEGNLIPYLYEAGYDRDITYGYFFEVVYKLLKVLENLVNKELDNVYDMFQKDNCVYIYSDFKSSRYNYFQNYDFEPPFIKRRCKTYNSQMVHELKDIKRVDDNCYIIARYLPFIDKDTTIRPLLVIFIYENKKITITKYIKDEKPNYGDIFLGMLYDLLSENGLPKKCYFDFREFYYAAFTTLKHLNIDATLDTLEDYTTNYFEEALEEIFTLATSEYLDEDEMYNILVEGVSIFTAKLFTEMQKGNLLINQDEIDEKEDNELDFLDNNQTQ